MDSKFVKAAITVISLLLMAAVISHVVSGKFLFLF